MVHSYPGLIPPATVMMKCGMCFQSRGAKAGRREDVRVLFFQACKFIDTIPRDQRHRVWSVTFSFMVEVVYVCVPERCTGNLKFGSLLLFYYLWKTKAPYEPDFSRGGCGSGYFWKAQKFPGLINLPSGCIFDAAGKQHLICLFYCQTVKCNVTASLFQAK